MILIAEQLKEQQTKDAAMREAKLDLQRQVNAEVHKQLALQETVRRYVHNHRTQE